MSENPMSDPLIVHLSEKRGRQGPTLHSWGIKHGRFDASI